MFDLIRLNVVSLTKLIDFLPSYFIFTVVGRTRQLGLADWVPPSQIRFKGIQPRTILYRNCLRKNSLIIHKVETHLLLLCTICQFIRILDELLSCILIFLKDE